MILLSAARSFPYKNHLTLFHPHFCASTKITDLRAPLPTRLGLQNSLFKFLNERSVPTATVATASAVYETHQRGDVHSRVIKRQWLLEHSDEHDAEHGARSGSEQLPARSETTKPGASSCHNQPRRTGPWCERNGVE